MIREKYFTVVLPGEWERSESGDDLIAYSNLDALEGLTVSVLMVGNVKDSNDQRRLLGEVLELRRKAELQTSTEDANRSDLRISENGFGASGVVLAGRFGSTWNAGKGRAETLVLVGPSQVTIFYFETLGLSTEQFETRAREILDSVGVPE